MMTSQSSYTILVSVNQVESDLFVHEKHTNGSAADGMHSPIIEILQVFSVEGRLKYCMKKVKYL